MTVSRGDIEHVLVVKAPRSSGTIYGRESEQFQSEAETWARLDDYDRIVSDPIGDRPNTGDGTCDRPG